MTVEEAMALINVFIAREQDKDMVRSVLKAVYEHGKAEGREEIKAFYNSLQPVTNTVPSGGGAWQWTFDIYPKGRYEIGDER